jgi:PAS domain S-box-containing protein
MVRKLQSQKQETREVAELRQRVDELEQTLNAIQNGEVDALVVSGSAGDQVYTLKSAERPYRVMIEQMSEGALTLSNDGIILFCNDSFARMIKYPLEEIVATPISRYIDSSSQKQYRRLEKNSGRGEISFLAKDKTLIPVYIALNTVREGEIINHCLVVTDLTEHIHNEQIIASERFARTLLDQVADVILISDPSGTIIRASEKTFDLLGGDLVGKPLDQIFKQIYLASETDLTYQVNRNSVKFSEIRDKKIPSGSEVLAISVNKLSRNLLLNYSQIIEGSSVLGYSVSLSDITDRKKAEDDLKQYAAKLEIANKEMEAFSYSVSHDLRAPLRALDGFSQLVISDYKDKLDDTGKDYLDRIHKASQTMSELIDDMLKLSRITRTEIFRNKIDLSSIAQSIITELKATQPERQVEWIIPQNIIATGDQNLLTITLKNLLENAWKFTGKCPQSRVEFGVIQQKSEKVYFIKDNGVGFDTKMADKLFLPFQRLHSDKEYAGTGIGLAIVERIIRLHNGKVWADSEIGQGSTFYFTLG